MLNGGASYEAIGYRVGATKEASREHYDHPSDDEECQRHRDEILDASVTARGYSNSGDDSSIVADGGEFENIE